MLCCASSRFWRSPAPVTLLVIVMVSCILAVGAQPAARRSEASANSADNSLRQSHSPRHRARDEPRRILCGTDLRNELAKVCDGRGYNGFGAAHSNTGFGSGGAASRCCDQFGTGCNRWDLDSYCNPAPLNDTGLPGERASSSASVEQVSESPSEGENTETTNNQLETNPVVEEETKSVNIVKSAESQIDAETENAIFRESMIHKFYVKTNDYHQVNSPVTTRRQSTIR